MMTLAQTILSEQTLVSLGTALAVLTPIALAFGWLQGKLNKIDNKLEALSNHARETWSFTQQEAWVLRLGKRNPNLDIPEPERVEMDG